MAGIMIGDVTFTLSDHLSTTAQLMLDDLLDRHNIERTGIRDARTLAIVARSADGQVLAGLHGYSWGGYCEIKTLFVVAEYRGRGLGRRMMKAVEIEAIARGCRKIVLSTHRFQAPSFYEGLGFSRVAELEDCPVGDAYILMAKACAPPGGGGDR